MSYPSTSTAASVSGRPAKEMAIEAQSRSRGFKQSHHGPNSGNGNINLIDLNPDSNPDTYDQHRERARSPGSPLPSPTTANPNGQANQNSVLQTTNQTLAHQATQLAHQAPQILELNNEYLLAYNKYLVLNSEFARVHQQMIQERRQQQLAREEAAELRERVRTALAKAIAASSHPDLDQADPLPLPTTGGSPGGGSTAPISTKPGSAAASQPLNQTLANPKGLANQNMVPQTNPNSVPQTSNTLAHQANPIKQLPRHWKIFLK
jgi:hypothetical protein